MAKIPGQNQWGSNEYPKVSGSGTYRAGRTVRIKKNGQPGMPWSRIFTIFTVLLIVLSLGVIYLYFNYIAPESPTPAPSSPAPTVVDSRQ